MEYVNKSIKYLLSDNFFFSIIGLCLFKNPRYNYIGYVLIPNIFLKSTKKFRCFFVSRFN